MKSIAIDGTGDIVIENNEIIMATGDDLLRQKVQTVLKTNLREWFFDWDQGINFSNILGKGINSELVRYEIERGLKQVDSTFGITEFAFSVDKIARHAVISFKAKTENGEEVGGEYKWA